MRDYTEQYNNVCKAIEAIENGVQEYRIGSRTVKRADLSVLYRERGRLEDMIESQEAYGTTKAVLIRR